MFSVRETRIDFTASALAKLELASLRACVKNGSFVGGRPPERRCHWYVSIRCDRLAGLTSGHDRPSSRVVTTAAILLAVLLPLLLLLLLLLKTARLRALCRQGSRASVRRTLAAVALPLRPAHSVPAAPLGEGEVAVE